MATPAAAHRLGNRLLDALPAGEVCGLAGDIVILSLKAKQSTQSAGERIVHVDFPIDAVLSVVATLKTGETVEVGTVGNESFVELEVALDSTLASRTSFCQVEGRVGRMGVDQFRHHMATSDAFARAMRTNVRAALFSSQQFAVCNLKHTVIQRCARWLAMTADRVDRPQFSLSREFLAIMLGAKAPVVAEATDRLERSGAVAYRASDVRVLDSGVLHNAACECYGFSKAAFAASLVP
jgi:CRP-like cAMP-binding protein